MPLMGTPWPSVAKHGPAPFLAPVARRRSFRISLRPQLPPAMRWMVERWIAKRLWNQLFYGNSDWASGKHRNSSKQCVTARDHHGFEEINQWNKWSKLKRHQQWVDGSQFMSNFMVFNPSWNIHQKSILRDIENKVPSDFLQLGHSKKHRCLGRCSA